MKTLLAIAAFTAATPALAQDILIRGATVHTATAKGTLANADVLIRNGKIQAVGTDLSAGSDAVTVDAKGRALTPGMFAGLTTTGIQEVSQEPTTDDATLGLKAPAYDMQWRPEFDVTTAFNPRSVLIPVTRVEGMTWTVLSPGSGSDGAFLAGQGAGVTLDGRYEAVLDGSRSLFIYLGGQLNSVSGGSRAAQWMFLEQAIHETRVRPAGDNKTLLHPLGREAFARYLGGGRVVFGVDRAKDIVDTLAFAKKYGFKPVISGGAEAWVVAEQLAAAKVPVLLDPLTNLPNTFDSIGSRLDNAALLNKAGVTIAFTQFGESHNARKVRQLAGNAAAHGLPKDAALAAITSAPAEIFGLGATRGHIAVGQTADVVLWSGDPLEVTSYAEQVWIAGKPVPMTSRQLELRDRYLERLRTAR